MSLYTCVFEKTAGQVGELMCGIEDFADVTDGRVERQPQAVLEGALLFAPGRRIRQVGPIQER
jgi:hypothetical protein